MLKIIALILIGIACSSGAQTPGALSYTGETAWDGATGTLSFTSSGTMPLDQEEFFWLVPQEVRRIAIAANATVRRRIPGAVSHAGNPLRIEGADRETSVIFGTEEERWTTTHGIADDSKWTYGAVSVLADATVYVSDLTSLNPRGYRISGYAHRSVVHVARCKLVDSRAGHNNNSDGFIGSDGSTITDSFISTGDVRDQGLPRHHHPQRGYRASTQRRAHSVWLGRRLRAFQNQPSRISPSKVSARTRNTTWLHLLGRTGAVARAVFPFAA